MASAVGIAPHTGWSWLVRVSGSPRAPRVEGRVRVAACGAGEGHLYHRTAERTRDRAGFLERERAAALAQALGAIAPHVGGAQAAIVVGKPCALPPLERILSAHPLLHAAEGELWRALFAEACAAAGLAVDRAEASAVRAAVERRHGAAAVEAFLALGKAQGPPWGKEVQEAALAGWSVL